MKSISQRGLTWKMLQLSRSRILSKPFPIQYSKEMTRSNYLKGLAICSLFGCYIALLIAR